MKMLYFLSERLILRNILFLNFLKLHVILIGCILHTHMLYQEIWLIFKPPGFIHFHAAADISFKISALFFQDPGRSLIPADNQPFLSMSFFSFYPGIFLFSVSIFPWLISHLTCSLMKTPKTYLKFNKMNKDVTAGCHGTHLWR